MLGESQLWISEGGLMAILCQVTPATTKANVKIRKNHVRYSLVLPLSLHKNTNDIFAKQPSFMIYPKYPYIAIMLKFIFQLAHAL